MTWARLDDSFYSHPKIRKAWRMRASIGLHVLAISYCADHSLDGKLPAEFAEDQLPDPDERDAAVTALIDAGLWKRNGQGFEVHDFLAYNPSRADLTAQREADRQRKARK